MARMWCSWPCSTPRPCLRSTPSEVPNNDDSMSWVASALPANSTSTKPASTRATIAGAAPVWTTAGPPTQRIFRPSALTSRICCAIWRTSRACGFSDGHLGVHELEAAVAAVDRRQRHDLHAAGAAHDLVAGADVAHRRWCAPGRRRRRPAVHLGVLDRHPVAAEPHHGLEVGRRVEVVGEHAVRLDLAQQRLAGVDRG